MSNDFRKRVLMGTKFESTVSLRDYGNVEVRVRALSELVLTQIEERTGETATGVMVKIDESQNAIKKKYKDIIDVEAEEAEETEGGEEPAPTTVDTSVILALNDDMMKMFSPSVKRFLAEVAKKGLLVDPDPDCEKCKGNDPDCAVCGPSAVVDALRGTAKLEIGIAVLSASLADWKEVEDFFSPKTEESGPE